MAPEKQEALMRQLSDPDNYRPNHTKISRATGIAASTVYDRHSRLFKDKNPFVQNQKLFVVKPKNLCAVIETLIANGGRVVGAEPRDDGDFEVAALLDGGRPGELR